IVLGESRVVRAHLDYDGNALVFRTPTDAVDPVLEDALADAFPEADLRRIVPVSPAATGGCQVRFPLPLDLAELRSQMDTVRAGLFRLLQRFEPGRWQAVAEVVGTFGDRATLARIRDRRPSASTRPLPRRPRAATTASAPPAHDRPVPDGPLHEGTVH
ncbi:MAG: hypothetical protein RLN75_04775, partial [Longimicrobiales bacterium]